MGILRDLKANFRHWYHRREIDSSLRHYKKRTGRPAHRRHRYAESGSFRSQVDRLFELGSPAETDQLMEIASGAVNLSLVNQFYRPADFLSDIVDALDAHTYVSWEPEGESPISELSGPAREAKIKHVKRAWLAGLKISMVEELVIAHTRILGNQLHSKARGRFERAAAKLFSVLDDNEVVRVKDALVLFLEALRDDEDLWRRFPEPAKALQDVTQFLTGQSDLRSLDHLRTRRLDQPLRLSTVVAEQRQELLEAGLACLE